MTRPWSCKLSIIVPVRQGEQDWQELVRTLFQMPRDWELIMAASEPLSERDQRLLRMLSEHMTVRWLVGPSGRAQQLNHGAAMARGRFLWFIHADTRLNAKHGQTLQRNLNRLADGWTLGYFDLAFDTSLLSPMRLNALGANLRSRVLGLPFGDQGFCLTKALFEHLGGFSEDASYGEDHLFVWRAKQHGVRLRRLPTKLSTSPRKYRQQGWLTTTSEHVYLTVRQALPELWKLVKARVGQGGV